jgi:arginase
VKFPILISGDHSNAGGTMAGIKMAYPESRIGVIWIDAHADLHSPYTTPSGNIHGMPIAALMGDDHREMAKNEPKESTRNFWETLKKLGRRRITPKIQGRDLVFVALRSTEEEEEKIIAKEGIKAFRPSDIKELGIEAVAEQTLNHLYNCQYIYISFDVDSLDTQYSIGTGTPVDDGLTLDQAQHLIQTFCKSDKLVGMEITEINPTLDEQRPMHQVIRKLLQNVFI